MPASLPFSSPTPLSLLLKRYMSGQIADPSWNKLMSVFDDEGVTWSERMALAGFLNDVLEDPQRLNVNIPKLDEVQALLSATRMPTA